MDIDDVGEVRAYWASRALSQDLSEETVTHPDRFQRQLEIEVALQHLPCNQRVLDVGCGNGFSTAIFARYSSHVVGIDYLEPMIRRAQEKYGSLGNVNFQVEDVISLPFDKESFDVVISQRCLINLTSWLDQMKAIHQIHRVVKPGGFFILQEGSRQGRECLNQAREMLGLMRMPTVEYNLDFDEETLWPFLRELFDIVDVRRFGLYDLISRVVHPLQVSPEEPKYDAKINEVAAKVCARMHGAEPMAREFSAVMRRPVKM